MRPLLILHKAHFARTNFTASQGLSVERARDMRALLQRFASMFVLCYEFVTLCAAYNRHTSKTLCVTFKCTASYQLLRETGITRAT